MSTDGKTLYVSGPAGQTPGQTTVQPVTVQNLQLGTPFSLPYAATGIRMNPLNGTLTSASNIPNLVASYNVGSDGVEPPSPIYGEATAPSNAAIPLPDGSKVYSVSATGTSIRVLNGNSLAPLSEIPVTNQSIYSTYPGGAASPDGTRAYLLDIGVQVVDATTDTIVGNIPPTSTWTPTAVAVSPDSSTLFGTWQWQGNCQVTSYQTGNLQQIATSGTLPGVFLSASVSPDGTKLYLLDAFGGILAVLNASTLDRISLKFDVPGGGGVLTADESTLYTLVGSGGPPSTSLTLDVVDVATLQVLKTYPIVLPQGTNAISSAYLALTPDGFQVDPLCRHLSHANTADRDRPINWFADRSEYVPDRTLLVRPVSVRRPAHHPRLGAGRPFTSAVRTMAQRLPEKSVKAPERDTLRPSSVGPRIDSFRTARYKLRAPPIPSRNTNPDGHPRSNGLAPGACHRKKA